MNQKIANSLSGYFETLYSINQNLIKLCGINFEDTYLERYSIVLRIIQDIPRIIPYSYNKSEQKLKLNDKNGLLEYDISLNYLKNDYKEILNENYIFLDKVRKIRNKYEHKMHSINKHSSGGGSLSYFDFTFKIEKEKIKIEAKEFINLIIMLNNLFEKLSFDVKKYACENNKSDYAYYKKLTRISFQDFNKIYKSNLLREFGRILSNF